VHAHCDFVYLPSKWHNSILGEWRETINIHTYVYVYIQYDLNYCARYFVKMILQQTNV